MAKFAAADIRNLALVGHSGGGKTTLTEAILLAAGVISKAGGVDDGSTQSDSQPEEKAARRSIYNAIFSIEKDGHLYNIIDTPGYLDFAGQPLMALSAVESAVLVVNVANPVGIGARKAWEYAERFGLARMVVVNHMDSEAADFAKALGELQALFGRQVAPVAMPLSRGGAFSGAASLLAVDVAAEHAAAREQLVETIVSADDALLERYLETGEVAAAELERVMKQAVAAGALVPVAPVSAATGVGVDVLIECIRRCLPDASKPVAKLQAADGNQSAVPLDGQLRACVFRVAVSEFVGKVSVFRVYSGAMTAGNSVTLWPAGKSERIPKLYRLRGDEQEEVQQAAAGEIVATAKVEALALGVGISDGKQETNFAPIRFPVPLVSRAIAVTKRGDEGRVSDLLRRISEEDPTFRYGQDAQTKELIIGGNGEQHLRAVLERLKLRNKLELETRIPKIAYLETVTGTADVRYRHKKQTGGAGQFAECAILIEPQPRGAGYEFVDKIFGGAISQQYRPSVDKGVQDAMRRGVLAGYPVVDVKVTLHDGKEHPVDSGDIPFQIAGRQAFWEAMGKANAVLLEPIVSLEVTIPAKYMGDVSGDIASRRGRVTGMDSLGDLQIIRAQAPLAEMQAYASQLQGLTQGEGFFAMELSHYEQVPLHIAQNLIAQAQREREAQKED